jgi:sensor c-di-GMP phosphodiesterase-like protein
MRRRGRRILFALSLTVVGTAAGIFAGYQAGRAYALRTVEGRLVQYAGRLVADAESYSEESRTALAAISASPSAFCSNAEISYFRAMIFESQYLRDVGRMRDGRILCSASLGRVADAAAARPTFRQQDGSNVYRNLSQYSDAGVTTLALQLGDSFVVSIPATHMHLEPSPMHFAETLMDAPTQSSASLIGEEPPIAGSALMTEGQMIAGKTLFATRCSIRFFSCFTAFTSVGEALASERRVVSDSALGGGMLGALVALLCSLAYRRNSSMAQRLRRAIRRDHLSVVYQPIVNMATRKIIGAEALVRWTDDDGAAIGPDVFVRVAEQSGFVGEITRLVLRHALRDLGETLRTRPDFRLSINISADDLYDPWFPAMLEESLARVGVAAQRLTLEITESSTVQQQQAKDAIEQLRRRGHRVHIDDFGTGYSSLSYLYELHVDAIKIDRAFTRSIGTGSVVVAILPQILAMAEALELAVIVEGVETAGQASYFDAHNRPILGQGWLFGRPGTAAALRTLLAADAEMPLAAECVA